jgi:hypothetical protein
LRKLNATDASKELKRYSKMFKDEDDLNLEQFTSFVIDILKKNDLVDT